MKTERDGESERDRNRQRDREVASKQREIYKEKEAYLVEGCPIDCAYGSLDSLEYSLSL